MCKRTKITMFMQRLQLSFFVCEYVLMWRNLTNIFNIKLLIYQSSTL
jgi:hypothetical protein